MSFSYWSPLSQKGVGKRRPITHSWEELPKENCSLLSPFLQNNLCYPFFSSFFVYFEAIIGRNCSLPRNSRPIDDDPDIVPPPILGDNRWKHGRFHKEHSFRPDRQNRSKSKTKTKNRSGEIFFSCDFFSFFVSFFFFKNFAAFVFLRLGPKTSTKHSNARKKLSNGH